MTRDGKSTSACEVGLVVTSLESWIDGRLVPIILSADYPVQSVPSCLVAGPNQLVMELQRTHWMMA